MKISLAKTDAADDGELRKSIRERRSRREFASLQLDVESVSQLLWAAQGVTGADHQRAAPSAGARYPMEIYAVAAAVETVPPGVYRYAAQPPGLQRISAGDRLAGLYSAALDDQPWVSQSALILVLGADFAAMRSHFEAQPPIGQRGDRYIYLESGAIAQNVCLLATQLGLGAVLVAGFDDDQVSACLQLPAAIKPTALLCIGVPA